MKKSKQMANKGKKVLSAPPTNSTDLALTLEGNTLTTTISEDAQWAGIQKFVDQTTNDGAVSVGNWNFASAPGPGTTKSVEATGPGSYRGWTSDFSYNIHYSNWIQVS